MVVIPIDAPTNEMRLTLGVLAIAEVILFSVCSSEDIISEEIDCKNSKSPDGTELNGVERKVSGLERVGEWYVGEITNGEHETKAIAGNVHGSKQRGLGIKS